MKRRNERFRQHIIEDQNLLAHCCINVTTWSMVEYGTSHGENEKNTDYSIEQIGEIITKRIKDDNIKGEILRLHDRAYLLEAFAAGKTEFSFEYQKVMAYGRCIWVNSVFHLFQDQERKELLVYEYCYDVNLEKTMNILMEFAVNDDYDLMGFANQQDGSTIMLYGRNSYNPHGTVLLEDDYQRSLIDFAANAVVASDRERYLELAELKNVGKYLETHESLEFYFQVKKEGQIQSKKVRYMKYREDENNIIFIQSDITKLIEQQKEIKKQLEDALEAAKIASGAKTSFLSQMSHEIRTPMNAIIGMTKLAKQTDNKEEVHAYLQQIDDSSQYLLGILNDILDMSRIESGKLELHPQWIDGCRVVLSCIEMLKPAMANKKIHFIYPLKMKESNIRLYLDQRRMQQIYMNLLNNAIKFTPEGGTIEISMKNLSLTKDSGVDRICIRDTGCGMSEEFLTRIFQPFEMEENVFSPEVQGTGLGLALVKSFLTKMGGKIWVESELGKGSTFTFELPYAYKEVDSVEKEVEKKVEVRLKGKHILLVDDHPLNRQIATKLLEHEEAEVTTAVDGQDACDQFGEASPYYYDVILMDIRMPKMDGLEATKQIRSMERADAKETPIIAMTANAFDEDIRKSLEAGMNAHLSKPIEPDKLMEAIQMFMG